MAYINAAPAYRCDWCQVTQEAVDIPPTWSSYWPPVPWDHQANRPKLNAVRGILHFCPTCTEYVLIRLKEK